MMMAPLKTLPLQVQRWTRIGIGIEDDALPPCVLLTEIGRHLLLLLLERR